MSKLIEELKIQHKVIIDTLNKVKSIGVNSEEGQKILLAAKKAFISHLNKEDKELYPVLKNVAETNTELKHTLHLYAKDMDEVSKSALEFFNKYSTDGSGLDFPGDFGRLWMMLTQRIKKEENTLYEKYDEIV